MAKKSTKKAAQKKTTKKSASSTRKATKSTKRGASAKSTKKAVSPEKKTAAAKKKTGAKKVTATRKSAATKSTAAKKSTKKAATKKSTAKKTVREASAARPAASKKSTKPAAKAKASRKSAGDAIAAPTPAAPSKTKPRATAKPAGVSVEEITKNAARNRPLTPKDVEEFRVMLLQKRAEILGDVNALQGEGLHGNRQDAAGDLSSMPIHMADLGSDNYELEFTLGLIEGERAILKEIDEALDRVREGKYGYCLATGNPIGKARLRATPWAKYCYEYTLAQERGQIHGS